MTIQQMIDAAVAAGGGIVSVPAGDHIIDQSLKLSGNRVHLTTMKSVV